MQGSLLHSQEIQNLNKTPDAMEEQARIFGHSGKPLNKYQIAINSATAEIVKEKPKAVFSKGMHIPWA